MSTAVDVEHGAAAKCPNCDAVISGHFCSHCGQEAILHHASTREFLHEFIGHYVALEGKLWGTLTRLLFRPGALTNEYIKGRRVRFVQPLRLYLTLSVLFFALMKFTNSFYPQVETDVNDDPAITAAATTGTVQAVDRLSKAQSKLAGKLAPLTPEQQRGKEAAEAAIASMEKDVGVDAAPDAAPKAAAKAKSAVAPAAAASASASASAPEAQAPDSHDVDIGDKDIGDWLKDWPKLKHQWQVFEKLPSEEKEKVYKEGLYHYAPYAVFCLMPVFALLLKILYLGSGRRFGEHLLFALHTNAFAFFMFSVMFLVRIGVVKALLWVWLLGYLPWAMRRVYHRSRVGTFWRWSTLMFFYTIGIGLAVLGSMAIGIMTAGH